MTDAKRVRLLAVSLALAISFAALWLVPDPTRGLLFNTLRLSGAVAIIAVPLGTLLAWLLVRTDMPGRNVILMLLAMMLFVPLYLQAAAWQAGFGLQGWWASLAGPAGWFQGWPAAVWIHSLAALPWVVLIAGAGFRFIRAELEEQALLDGSAVQVFLHVALPGAASAIAVAALWIMIWTAGEMTVTDLFAVRTYAEEIYTQFAVAQEPSSAPLGIASAAILIVGLVMAALAMIASVAPRDPTHGIRPPRLFLLGRWRWLLAAAVGALLLLAVGVPLASLVYQAGVVVTPTSAGVTRAWSPVKCLAIVTDSPWRYRREFGWSLSIGGLAATASVVAAIVLAWAARHCRAASMAASLLAAVLLAVPGPAVGLAIIRLLNRPELPLLVWLYDQSILAPWLALVARSLPPAFFILWYALASVPRELLDAAAVDGAGVVRRLLLVALPLRWSAVAVAWLVAMAVALGDLAASILVAPPGVMLLSRRIFDLIHYGVEDYLAGVCLALVAMFAVTAAVVAWLTIRLARRQAREQLEV